MHGERKLNGIAVLAAAGFAIAVVAPVWAFFNVTVPFPPMLADDHGVTSVNTPVNINLVANDADADGRIDLTSVTLLTQPQHGIATVNPQTGVCTYAPGPGFAGGDKFSYQLQDDEGIKSNVGFVAVTVQPPPKVEASQTVSTQ